MVMVFQLAIIWFCTADVYCKGEQHWSKVIIILTQKKLEGKKVLLSFNYAVVQWKQLEDNDNYLKEHEQLRIFILQMMHSFLTTREV